MSDMRTIGELGPVTANMEDAALPPVRSEPLLADDDHLSYFLADGVLSTLEVSGRTVAARMILQAIDQYKANAGHEPARR